VSVNKLIYLFSFLKAAKIKLFLVFCEIDSKSKTILKTKTDFELRHFMINKNKEFKAVKSH
jgi:hypothetical protein